MTPPWVRIPVEACTFRDPGVLMAVAGGGILSFEAALAHGQSPRPQMCAARHRLQPWVGLVTDRLQQSPHMNAYGILDCAQQYAEGPPTFLFKAVAMDRFSDPAISLVSEPWRRVGLPPFRIDESD